MQRRCTRVLCGMKIVFPPKIETEFDFKPCLNKTYVNKFNNQNYKKSAILTIKNYNPPNLIFQHLPVKEKVNKLEVDRRRNGYITDTLTSVDIQEFVKIGGKNGDLRRCCLSRKL